MRISGVGPAAADGITGPEAIVEQVTLDGLHQVLTGQRASIACQQPVIDVGGGDDVDRVLQRRHAGVLSGRDPLDLLRCLDASLPAIQVGARTHLDTAGTQMVGEHHREVHVDVHRRQCMCAAHVRDEHGPAILLAAGTAHRRREVELRCRANGADRRLFARASFFKPARPQRRLAVAAVDNHHGVVADLRRISQVHPAWRYGIGAMLACFVLTEAITYSPVGTALYRVVTEGSPGAAVPPLDFAPPPAGPLMTGRS